MCKKILYLGIFIFCFGCSVGPDFDKPEIYSDIQIAKALKIPVQSEVCIQKNWYKNFNDDSLTSLVEQGLKQSIVQC